MSIIKSSYSAAALVALIATTSALPSVALAQAPNLNDCRAIEDRLARFDCYEMVEASPQVEPARKPEAVVTTENFGREVESESPAADKPSLFRRLMPFSRDEDKSEEGARDEVAVVEGDVDTFGQEAHDPRLVQGADGRVELIDRVAALEPGQHKQWRIILESGQIWTQMLSKTYNLSVGDEVRITPIEKGRYYRLTSPKLAGNIQVRRLR